MDVVLDKNIKQINGPVNVVRLEGIVNRVHKVIYVFMDHHVNVQMQTECDNVFAKDIQQYLAENFIELNNSTTTYDFFFEIYPSVIQNIAFGQNYVTQINHRQRYIDEVVKLFRKLFVYDSDKNKVSISQIFKNVRLHYMDIRQYFEKYYADTLEEATYLAANMWHAQYINLNSLSQIINILKDFQIHCKFIMDTIKTRIDKKKPSGVRLIKYTKKQEQTQASQTQQTQQTQQTPEEREKEYSKGLDYIMHKLTTSYKNAKVKNLLAKQFDVLSNELAQLITDLDKAINTMNHIGDDNITSFNKLVKHPGPLAYSYNLPRNIVLDMLGFMVATTESLAETFIYVFTRFMDIYFLRRFLDKDYITNAITYTGAYHSNTYIEVLTKDFGFKITHVSYSKIPNITELNAQISKYNSSTMLEIFTPPVKKQCSDVTHFPKKFQ